MIFVLCLMCSFADVASLLLNPGVLGGAPQDENRALITTGYWKVASKQGNDTQASDLHYVSRMKGIMKLKGNIAIYGSADGLEKMTTARGDTLPVLVGRNEMSINQLPPCSTHPELYADPERYTYIENAGTRRPTGVPSVDLGCIWSGKLTLLELSMKKYPDFDWFVWSDVGMHDQLALSRLKNHTGVWPNPEKLKKLPTDKMLISGRGGGRNVCTKWEKYCRGVSAMAFVVHKSILPKMAGLFKEYQEDCLETLNKQKAPKAFMCLDDEHVLAHLAHKQPELFNFAKESRHGTAALVGTVSLKVETEHLNPDTQAVDIREEIFEPLV